MASSRDTQVGTEGRDGRESADHRAGAAAGRPCSAPGLTLPGEKGPWAGPRPREERTRPRASPGRCSVLVTHEPPAVSGREESGRRRQTRPRLSSVRRVSSANAVSGESTSGHVQGIRRGLFAIWTTLGLCRELSTCTRKNHAALIPSGPQLETVFCYFVAYI